MLRRRPSVPLLVVGLVVAMAALEPLTASLEPTTGPAAWVGDPVHTTLGFLVFVVGLRGYVDGVVASELTDSEEPAHRPFADVLVRFGSLLATMVAVVALLAVTMGVAILVVSLLVFEVGLFGQGVFEGTTPTLLFGGLLVPVFYKFWLAPEVAVLGRTGPLTALRESWTITTAHWRRVTLLLASFALTVGTPVLVANASPVAARPLIDAPGTDVLVGTYQWVSTTVWYCVGAQIYARSIVT